MFAIFGLGWAELVVLGIIGMLFVVVIGVLAAVRNVAPAPHRHDEIADLRAENAELRDEVRRLKKELDTKASRDGIIADDPS